jgi:hypothetical protein
MTKLIRTFCAIAVVGVALVALVATNHSVALAHARSALVTPTCNTTTDDLDSNFDAPIPSFNGNITCIVGPGSVSSAVGELQKSLNHCYSTVIGSQLTVDNNYGPLTTEAMQDAQAVVGVPQDGVYGPQTRGHGFLFWGVTVQHPRLTCGTDLS